MPLNTAEQQALTRLQSFYEGDNPYNSVTNPGGFRQGGHLYNFVNALKDLAVVIVGAARLATEVATNSAQSPKAVRVDADQNYTDGEKAQGQKNLGLAAVLTPFLAKAGDTMTGNLRILRNGPALTLRNSGPTTPDKAWNILNNDSDGLLYLQAYNADAFAGNPFYFSRDGSLYTQQMGDLNARIENRAAAYAAQRLALTGGTLTGGLAAPNFTAYGTDGSSGFALNSRTNSADNILQVNQTGQYSIYNLASQKTPIQINVTTGAINTLELGDLNARIEARGAAYRDAAVATAGQADALRVLKSGDTMTGILAISVNYPAVRLTYPGTGTFGWQVNPDKTVNWYDFADNSLKFQISNTGAVYTLQFGDLNNRIEARGLAYQQAAQATSVQKNVSGRQDLIGALATSGYLDIVVGNVLRARWVVDGNANVLLQNGDSGDNFLYTNSGGGLWLKQFGDLNSRIEDRATAYQNAAVNRCLVAIRLVYVGDESVAAQFGGGMREAYGASYISGRTTALSNDQQDIVINQLRYRQVQFNIPNQGWVASYYA